MGSGRLLYVTEGESGNLTDMKIIGRNASLPINVELERAHVLRTSMILPAAVQSRDQIKVGGNSERR